MDENPIYESQYTIQQIEDSIGKTPIIDPDTKEWKVWDIATSAYVGTGIIAESETYAEAAAASAQVAQDYADNIADPVGGIVAQWIADNLSQETGYVIDTSLTVQGAAADAKTVGTKLSGALTNKGNTTSAMDINSTTFARGGQWYVPSSGRPTNFPFSSSSGRIIVFGADTTAISGKTQVVISASGSIAYRTGVSNTWNRWRYFVNNEMIDSTLSIEGDAADAKATGDAVAEVDSKVTTIENGAIPYGGVINSSADINDVAYACGGQWYVSSSLPTNWPFSSGYGRLVTFAPNTQLFSGSRIQLAVTHYTGEIAFRTSTSDSGNWSDWRYLAHSYPHYSPVPLEGKSLCIVGTSFVRQSPTMSGAVDPDKQWANIIIKQFHMNGFNNGLAGTTVAKVSGDSGNSVWERLTKSGGILTDHTNTQADKDNGTQYPGKTVDYFIVQGGGNDRSKDVPIGNIDDATEYTFHGALNLIASAVRAAYPKAKLFYITCFRRWLLDAYPGPNRFGLVDKDYAEAMVANARYNSIRCFDAWHDSGLYPYYGPSSGDDTTYAWPWISRSNKHLNIEGNAFVAPIISSWLNNEGV